jgi:hypothetical protein
MPKIAPRLQRRGGKYYIRAKVPADLRHILGKREFHYSLKTSDLSEARRRVHLESLKIDSARCHVIDHRKPSIVNTDRMMP